MAPIEDIQLASLRDNISLVSQEVVLFNDTVSANIAYGRLRDTTQRKHPPAAQCVCAGFHRKNAAGL